MDPLQEVKNGLYLHVKMSAISRNVVYWVGLPPTNDEKLEFEQRNLLIRILDNDLTFDFNVARALVYKALPPSLPVVYSLLKHYRAALNNGLIVYLIAADDAIQAHLMKEVPDNIRNGHLAAQVRCRTGHMPSYECAENIARHEAGRYANPNLQIQLPMQFSLNEDQEFIVRRAFNDCSAISLEPLTGGRSATAFLVQATLSASEVGPRPLPFFVKLDVAHKILKEVNNYQLYATLHIPWYLRPNLDHSRCLQGINNGILVGSFVEQSESLWQAILNGKGPRYIHGLFEETLMGWRSQAYRRQPVKCSLANSLAHVFQWEKVPKELILLASEHGDVLQPKELWEQLLNLPEHNLRYAPMHGDMHGENVRVRNNDAIIIDLANACNGPLCADVASLEVWITFEVPSLKVQIPDRAIWKHVVNELFTPSEVIRPPRLASMEFGVDWLRGCIRQTRMIAGAICECDLEYPTAIAIHLLRRAQYKVENEEDGYRRSFAYYLGSQLVKWLTLEAINSGAGKSEKV